MDNVKIRIGGVPEHYNLPIHLANEQGAFSKRGIDLEWTDFGGGTGQMTKALREGEIDVCILLTEGIVADIIKGNSAKIISEYVLTPLTWGIHTGVKNKLEDYRDIFDKQYAISRFGSGSHLMAIVDAESKGHHLQKEQFHVIKDINGALPSLDSNETDVFYWEKYTTKPYVDQGKLKRIGEYRTPWPCFVIAARDEILQKYPDQIIRMLRVIHDQCDRFMLNIDAPAIVSSRYGLQQADAERWYNSTEWAIHGWVSDKMLENVIYHLKTAEIIDKDQEVPELIWKRN
ncbi:substrate-binding domain-containing protein [Paracrocinitomix mangrovi]|uniref:substrate-binding domain-containing protein n=1 Tax=Paracrocinitomix mangrovi TaxID=2862509 RepID=UPI001C8D486E|nr:substrate-binding domain-containing protein [Paracrocinitomix mangrovi]UKN02130.1 substrate-binding domain-containing protein [Paracrocinitomix mangrovi]